MKHPHILFPTDLSEESLRPLARVAEFAAPLGGKITLLFVLQELVTLPYGYPYIPPASVPDLAEQLERARGDLAAVAERLGGSIEVGHDTAVGERVDTSICQYASEHGVDMIAMSSHGRSGVRRFFLGSVAEAVLRTARIPVLVFPPPGHD